MTTKIETNIQTGHFAQHTVVKYNTYHDFTMWVSFIKIKITFTIKTWFHCGAVVAVEAAGGGFEKMLYVKLILGKPFQALTPRAIKPVNHAAMVYVFYNLCTI